MKKCGKCNQEKSLTEFYHYKTFTVQPCKACRHIWKIEYHKKNREKILEKNKIYYQQRGKELLEKRKKDPEWQKARKNYQLQRDYGVTLIQVEEMYKKQNGNCEGCGKKMLFDKNCVVDHDHETGKVRGLLHSKCNLMLGLLEDDSEILQKFMTYLENSKIDLPAII